MTDSYVIGLSPYNLIDVEFGCNYNSGKMFIRKIVHGLRNIDEATVIGGKKDAQKMLKEIQDRYDEINVSPQNILESIIDGDDIDPMQLHIYEVIIGREVM